MNGNILLNRVRLAFCIFLLQASLALLISGCEATSCHLQAVAGGSEYCEEP